MFNSKRIAELEARIARLEGKASVRLLCDTVAPWREDVPVADAVRFIADELNVRYRLETPANLVIQKKK